MSCWRVLLLQQARGPRVLLPVELQQKSALAETCRWLQHAVLPPHSASGLAPKPTHPHTLEVLSAACTW